MTRLSRALASNARQHLSLTWHLVRWIVLGALSGALAGVASAAFLTALDRVTDYRADHPDLLYALPLAGIVVGLAYLHLGGDAARGNDLILDEIHEPRAWVPRRMAPLVLVGTLVTHLFGGSAGREGTAIQMSGSLTDLASRVLRLGPDDRRIMLISAIAGGFGSVFGVPLAGAVFALEVQSVGWVRYEALAPCLAASVIGDIVVAALGVHHAPTPQLAAVSLTVLLIAKVAVAGVAFGLTSVAFAELTHAVKRVFTRIAWAPARPLIGGALVVVLTVLVGTRQYNGLSTELIDASLLGAGVTSVAFALKVVFTSVTLGSGFPGGEVTPLFVIGATLGATLASPLGVSPHLLAAMGFVAVFAGASNTPLACTIMGVELFGGAAVPYFATACVVSYVFSTHRSIYASQRAASPKLPRR